MPSAFAKEASVSNKILEDAKSNGTKLRPWLLVSSMNFMDLVSDLYSSLVVGLILAAICWTYVHI